MKGNSVFKIHNYFDLTLTNTETGEERNYHAENIVLDNYYDTRIMSTSSGAIDTIQLGTGVGTLSTSRKSLFSLLAGHTYTGTSSNAVFFTEVAQLSERRYKIVLQTTFTETEANGELTEVGLAVGSGNNNLVTHALFTDSENNPITITKTNVDRLTITATLFAEYSITGVLKPFGSGYRPDGVTNPNLVCNTEIDLKNSAPWSVTGKLTTTNAVTQRCSNLPRLPALLLGRGSSLINNTTQGGTSNNLAITYYLVTIPSSTSHSDGQGDYRDELYLYYLIGTAKSYYTLSSGLFRAELSNQYNSGSGNIVVNNVTYTYQIKAIGWNQLAYIPLPNHDIFPPKLLTFELTADGTSTEYNLGVPELMTTNVEVLINGVVQDPSTYTFNGKDFNLIQAWASADTKYIKDVQAFAIPNAQIRTYSVPFPHLVTGSSNTGAGGREVDDGNGGQPALIYDFGSPKTVDTLASMTTSQLSYSSDGTNWTQVASITKIPTQSNPSVVYEHFAPVSARYWKVTFAVSRSVAAVNWDNPLISLHSEFDQMKPQLEFNTPPAAGSVITVKAYTEYPIKNANWIINGTVIDAILQRGNA